MDVIFRTVLNKRKAMTAKREGEGGGETVSKPAGRLWRLHKEFDASEEELVRTGSY